MPQTRLRRSCLYSLLIAAMMVSASSGQRRRSFPEPPAPAVRDEATSPDPRPSTRRLDTVAMEREARELAALASSIPGDIEQVKRGLLPKDALDKLKRIEKLSKQLRGAIHP